MAVRTPLMEFSRAGTGLLFLTPLLATAWLGPAVGDLAGGDLSTVAILPNDLDEPGGKGSRCNEGSVSLRQLRGRRLHGQVNSSTAVGPFIGMAYAAVPEKGMDWGIPCDDFMAHWSEPLWGPSGRNDLRIMRDMGVDMVRTYGIGSHLDHRDFLDHASKVGLKVMPGFADYAYTGSGSACNMHSVGLPADCSGQNSYDCHDAIQEHYEQMLLHGYTIVGEDGARQYHPAIHTVILVNELELKLHYGKGEVLGRDANHARVVASALDGLLSAEDALDIVGSRPLITATASYARCPNCKSVLQGFSGIDNMTPFLPFVADYFLAFQDPEGFVQYSARHDLMDAYTARWVNSFNTPRPAAANCEAEDRALRTYSAGPLGTVPVFIGEFHHSFLSPKHFYLDILKAKKLIHGGSCGAVTNPLVGFNIFEYQVSYWKGEGAEGKTALRYGLFGLGERALATTVPESSSGMASAQDVWCIFPVSEDDEMHLSHLYSEGHGSSVLNETQAKDTDAGSVIEALGGTWPHEELC